MAKNMTLDSSADILVEEDAGIKQYFIKGVFTGFFLMVGPPVICELQVGFCSPVLTASSLTPQLLVSFLTLSTQTYILLQEVIFVSVLYL